MSGRARDLLLSALCSVVAFTALLVDVGGQLRLAAVAPMLSGIWLFVRAVRAYMEELMGRITLALMDDMLPPAPRSRVQIARGAASLAAWIAGSERDMRNAWLAHLAGDPDAGIRLTSRQRTHAAVGFLWAALMYRLTDLCTPLIWVLRKDSRVNGVIAVIVGAQAVYITGAGGFSAFVTDVPEPCAITAGALYLFLRWLRGPLQVDVILAEPRARPDPPPQ